MRKLGISFGVLILLLIIAALALPALVPASVYKDQIQQQISASLGRDVIINGDVKLSVFPALSANASEVRIANADGFGDTPFATMENLQAKVKLAPLFKKQVEITEFTLVNPQISLSKTKTGDVNWAFGAPNTLNTSKPNTGFARDGRYTDLQISLGTFTLKNGTINFKDDQAEKTFTLRDVNLKMAMPGMDKPITAKGDLIFNDTPMTIDTRLDTPKSFLNAQAAPFFLKLKSDIINLTAEGQFTPSTAITFDIDFAADIPSISKLDKSLGIENPYSALTETAKLKAALSFDGATLTAKNADMALESETISTVFIGNFTAGQSSTATGALDISVKNLQTLQATLGMDIPQLKGFETVDLTADLSTDGKATTGENIQLDIKGKSLNARYTGTANFDTALSLAGQVSANSPSITELLSSIGMTAQPATQALGDFTFSSDVNGAVDALELSNLNFISQGDNLTASFTGSVKLGDTPNVNGTFNVETPSVQTLAKKSAIDLPYTNILGTLSAKGTVSGATNALSISALSINTAGEQLNANYVGDINLGKTPTVNGSFDIQAPTVKSLMATAGIALPYADALGALNAKGTVSGTLAALAMTGLDLNLSDGVLNIKFTGDANTGKTVSYKGHLNTNITSIRKLAALGGTQLAASTKQGEVYGPFALEGQASGTTTKVNFTDAKFTLDDIVGAGTFTADLAKSKPLLGGELNLEDLDLRPYMAAQNPTGKIQPWSEAPLNLAALKLFDANFMLNTPNILVGRMNIGKSNIKTTVKNGVLKANIPNVSLYGGKGTLDMTLNTNVAIPTVALDFNLNNMDGKGFLGAAAGFTKLTGNTGTTMKLRGAGRSQAEIMNSLNGDGNFELAEGIISGVDIDQFVNGLDTAFKTRALPSGLGDQYTTPFKKLAGLFSVKKGIVTIGDFNLNANNVSAEGAGTLNLGQQTIDFSFRPRLQKGTGLAAFGIPIRFKGGFGNVSAGLDTDLLTKIVTARAKAQVQKEISKQIGGDAGAILGGIIGDQKSGTTQTPTEDVLGDVLGGLLGTKQPTKNTEDDKKTDTKDAKKETQEDPLDKAFNSLFGGGN